MHKHFITSLGIHHQLLCVSKEQESLSHALLQDELSTGEYGATREGIGQRHRNIIFGTIVLYVRQGPKGNKAAVDTSVLEMKKEKEQRKLTDQNKSK